MPSKLILLHPEDNVGVALIDIHEGDKLDRGISAAEHIPSGHKLAVSEIGKGEWIKRYNQIIGIAKQNITPGQHVHSHNLDMVDYVRDYNFCADAAPTSYVDKPATFQGYVREEGRVATRNYIGVISSVNCSATVAKAIADHFRSRLDEYPNVDGVVALTHKSGCGLDAPVEGVRTFKKCISGFIRHPNFYHVVVVGLGCEIANLGDLLDGAPGDAISIQECNGTAGTIAEGIRLINEVLAKANAQRREEVPVSQLVVALQCGGSDGHSGVSSNPALGVAVDRLVRHGGTAILSETTEIYGAEHMLTRRAVSREVGEKLVDKVRWWEQFAAGRGLMINNNPSPGNKEGGLTTILEKSLGSVAKGGTTNLVEVYDYADSVTEKGLVFMDAPAFDPVGATAQVAGGANLMVFTTGRGSAFGCKPTPSLKLADNTLIYEAMAGDMDINCGTILDGTESVEEVGSRIFTQILAVASGEKTKSELLGYGEEEFSPWDLGLML